MRAALLVERRVEEERDTFLYKANDLGTSEMCYLPRHSNTYIGKVR